MTLSRNERQALGLEVIDIGSLQCLLWVINGHPAMSASRPLYPR